jgi:hypothetical protein
VQVTTIRLVPFPGPRPDIDVRVEIARQPGVLRLWYIVTGDLAALQIPAPAANPARANGLWEHTCCEAFLRGRDDEAYYEFNASPSGHWAAYRFDSYRQGMAYLRPSGLFSSTTQASHSLTVSVEIDLMGLSMSPPLRLGICAVIEDRTGGKSYWALRHAIGQPDFHHPDCFALELPAASAE